MSRFKACWDSKKYMEKIQRDINDARAVGITGTPSFVLGKTGKDGVQGIKIVGAQHYATFDQKIRELLPGAQ